jgi:hypothetical protein
MRVTISTWILDENPLAVATYMSCRVSCLLFFSFSFSFCLSFNFSCPFLFYFISSPVFIFLVLCIWLIDESQTGCRPTPGNADKRKAEYRRSWILPPKQQDNPNAERCVYLFIGLLVLFVCFVWLFVCFLFCFVCFVCLFVCFCFCFLFFIFYMLFLVIRLLFRKRGKKKLVNWSIGNYCARCSASLESKTKQRMETAFEYSGI